MPLEYKTLKFRNDSAGLREKDITLARWAAAGWRITAETIEQGYMKGGEACCLASTCCLPMGFLAGRTAGFIVVSLVRDRTLEMLAEPSTISAVDPDLQDAEDTRVGGYILVGIFIIVMILLNWYGCNN